MNIIRFSNWHCTVAYHWMSLLFRRQVECKWGVADRSTLEYPLEASRCQVHQQRGVLWRHWGIYTRSKVLSKRFILFCLTIHQEPEPFYFWRVGALVVILYYLLGTLQCCQEARRKRRLKVCPYFLPRGRQIRLFRLYVFLWFPCSRSGQIP